MRLGLLYQRAGAGDSFAAVVEQIVAADRLGFDSVWLEDRHFEDGVFGSLPIVLAALATRTRSIRLGSFAALACGHPVRAAEEYAMVDLLSGGRLDFGVVPGGRPEELAVRGVPLDEGAGRLAEALDIVLAAWALDGFSYGGEHYRFPAHTAPGTGLVRQRLGGAYTPQWERGPELPDFLSVTPKPLQQPRPPVWVLAGDADWVAFAAERGHSVVLPAGERRDVALLADEYEAALERVRRSRSEVELAAIVELPLDGGRVGAGAVEELHRLHGATGANHLLWRVPHPAVGHDDLLAALKQLACEVQPLLQA